MEDLIGYSGAGLYDSFVSVKPTVETLKQSISDVWRSLFSKRAVISRI